MDNCEAGDSGGSSQPSTWEVEARAGHTPVGCHGDFTPGRTPAGPHGDTTPAHSSQEPQERESPCDTSPQSDEESGHESRSQDHNPEPPKELLEKKLIDADNIGNTVFSQHWLFSALMKLIQVVDSHNEDKKESEGSESGLDLDEGLQDELCKLWDMSMNQEVVKFLLDFKTVDILTGVISKSKAPRATEICVGILGNMACNEEVLELLSSDTKLIALILMLLENPDAPTLVETTRLLHVCVSGEKTAQSWINAIKADKSVFTNICFILQSSTNGDLLRNTAELVDKVMDVDEELCQLWSTAQFVQACLEACKQASVQDMETADCLLHALQLVTTCEDGVQALLVYWEEVSQTAARYLVRVCSEDIVVIEGQENSLASVLSILAALFSSMENSLHMLSTDFQIVRCVFKIFQETYIKYHNVALENGESRRRRVRTTSLGSIHSNLSEHTAAEHTAADDTSLTPTHIQSEASHQTEAAAVERTASYDASMTKMLYEVMQGLLLDIVSSLSKTATDGQQSAQSDPSGGTNHSNGPHRQPVTENHVPSAVSTHGSSPSNVPKSLAYLNSMCERARLQYVLYCVQDTRGSQGMLAIPRLKMAAEHFRLARLCQIIEEICPSGT